MILKVQFDHQGSSVLLYDQSRSKVYQIITDPKVVSAWRQILPGPNPSKHFVNADIKEGLVQVKAVIPQTQWPSW